MTFWQALEHFCSGPAAVTAEWSFLLQGPIEPFLGYLRPRQELASGFPRIQAGQFVMPYCVAQVGPDEFVGYDEEGFAENIQLARSDLVVYELNRAKLIRELAVAFGLREGEVNAKAPPPAAELVGHYEPVAGFSFPAFLVITNSERLQRTIFESLATFDKPFLLLVPTARRIGPAARLGLERRGCAVLALADCVAITVNGLATTEAAGVHLQRFRSAHVQATAPARATAFFPTPAGAKWSNVSIRFIDCHTVSVRVDDVTAIFEYGQMGMANQTNARPNKQWELLLAFAEGHGVLRWDSRKADWKNKKRKSLLSQALKEFFRIDGEPIELSEDGKGWRSRFTINDG